MPDMDSLSDSGWTELRAELLTQPELGPTVSCPGNCEESQVILVASRMLTSGGFPSQASGLVLGSSLTWGFCSETRVGRG